MSHPAPASEHPEYPLAPLVAVHGLREEVAAGLGGASIRVRTLDDLSFAVHPSELVVVQGGVASGLSSMRRALAREGAAPGTRLRRGTIAAAARDAIVEAWRRPCPVPWPAAPRATSVYLLRVRPRGDADGEMAALTPATMASWQEWVFALRARGGAVVLFERVPRAVRVAHVVPRATRVREREGEAGVVRAYTLCGGRLVDAVSGRPVPSPSPSADSAT